MDCSTFSQYLDEYGELWHRGLKKQANSVMKELVDRLEKLPTDEERDALIIPLCQEFFARKAQGESPLGHHGRLPYGLEQLVEKTMGRQCDRQGMPRLRWYFELFRYNPTFSERALARLRQALACKDVDQESVNLYFDELLEWLWFGRHHFPEGCIYPTEEYHDLINEGEGLIRKFSLDDQRIASFQHHKRLYDCWDEWKARDKEGSFEDLCDEMGVPFRVTGTYCY